MNRRNFIFQSAAAGAAISLSTPLALADTQKSLPEVIVIGAGFSGLACAYALKNKGVKVTVLEARNRIGGRVFSYQPIQDNPLTIELGAEWVGASHERIIQLCKEFNIELLNNQLETDLMYEGQYAAAGNWDFSEEMKQFWNDRKNTYKGLSEQQLENLDKTDWWRYLSMKGFNDRDMDIRELLDSTDFGESNRHVSAYIALATFAESSEKNEMDLKMKGGNQQLAKAFAAAIGTENILTAHSVKSVVQSKGKVSLTCHNGTVFTADRVVCTIPTYSLMKIQWNPGLPAATLEALRALQYARIGKYPLVFSERFWKREDFDMVTDTLAHYFYHGTKNQPGNEGVLMAYATGDKADVLNAQPEETRVNLILEALRPAFGDVSKYLIKNTKYYWGKDAFSYGAYAIYAKNQWFSIRDQLLKNHGRVAFAGEHLADWQGFMEGAVNTGENAAEWVLAK